MTQSTQWWRGGIIYQIYPRSFMDSNGDGIGDLPGITSKLDYIASLGVDGIWISPFFKSPMRDGGYDVSDYCDVDPIFGRLDDFRELLNRAHALNLKVLIDQVWSHTSEQHPWFKNSRSAINSEKTDWYIWADPKPDGTPPNNWLSYFGGPAWTWDSTREQYYLHQFLKEQPNLNLWNPAVREALKETAAFWLDMGVDGFRLDAIQTYLSDPQLRDNPACEPGLSTDIPRSSPMARQLRKYTANLPEAIEWIEELRSFTNHWPDICLLAEVGGEDPEKAGSNYVKTSKRCSMAYSFALIGTTMSRNDILKPLQRIEELIEDGWSCWAASNHDSKRAASRLQGDAPLSDKALFATKVGLSLRGSYCLYEGEELGLPQAELAFEDIVDPYDKALYPKHMGRDGCRTPMPWKKDSPHAGFSTAKPWLPVSADHLPLSIDAQESDKTSVLHQMRSFIAWRQKNPAMRLGDIEILDMPEPILAFHRKLDGQKIFCIFNCGDKAQTVPASLIKDASLLYDISTGIQTNDKSIDLAPFACGFFE